MDLNELIMLAAASMMPAVNQNNNTPFLNRELAVREAHMLWAEVLKQG